MKLPFSIALFIWILSSCGTLGGFGITGFPVQKNKLSIAIESLYKIYPEYKMPGKWKHFDDWKERGYNFLDSRIFYFADKPEEMYYITFIEDTTTYFKPNRAYIAIRAVSIGNENWLLEKNFGSRERERIKKRFYNEIVSKLESLTKTNSFEGLDD